MTPISSLGVSPTVAPPSPTPAQGVNDGASFKDFLLESLDHVNSLQQDTHLAVRQLVAGGDANPAEVLTAVQKADLSFHMMMQVRNQLMQAVQEIKEIRI